MADGFIRETITPSFHAACVTRMVLFHAHNRRTFPMQHPCLCDTCLKARDDELRRAREHDFAKVVTVIDGCMVHGDTPMTPESRTAISELIAAVREKLAP